MANIPGINIQYPISQLILNGKKTIETRHYPLPERFINKDMALIETPGPSGQFKARAVAVIKFGSSFQYKSKDVFYKDEKKHCVSPGAKWAWKEKRKWGWPILRVKKLKEPLLLTKRKGIIYTNDVKVTG